MHKHALLLALSACLLAACADDGASTDARARDAGRDAPALDVGVDAPLADAAADGLKDVPVDSIDDAAGDARGDASDALIDQPPSDSTADTSADASADQNVDSVPAPSWLDNTLAALPNALSQVGIFPSPQSRARVDGRLIAYAPRYPLWTDGADKRRWIFLPPNTTVDNSSKAWAFPDGTVFFKHFEYPGQALETRLMRRINGSFEFAVYRWNAAGTDATLLKANQPTLLSVPSKPQVTYFIPSENQCKGCHDKNTQRVGQSDVLVQVIGFDELRLNAPLPGSTQTQLAALAARGLFSSALPATPAAVQGANASAIEAKGWLHGNCAHCHNSGFKFDANHALIEASAKAKLLLVPGSAQQSKLYNQAFNWGLQGQREMPPVGVSVYDVQAKAWVQAWINAL